MPNDPITEQGVHTPPRSIGMVSRWDELLIIGIISRRFYKWVCIIMVVADVLVPNRHQDISNHHDNSFVAYSVI